MSIEYSQYPQSHPIPVKKNNLYPLQQRMLLWGFIFAMFALLLQDWVVGTAVFALFAFVGASWRSDMPPILSACIAYQWISACAGYVYFIDVGYFPGGAIPGSAAWSLIISLMGFGAIITGYRIGFALFRKQIVRKTMSLPATYSVKRLLFMTIVAFGIQYIFEVAPKQIWFGGAQIVENLLTIRFIPLFVLSVAVFERKKNYTHLVIAALWVIGPQLLTGFARFKEILFVILIAALVQWRPWVRSAQQKRQNRRTFVFGVVGFFGMVVLGLIWSGGLKEQWRDEIWNQDNVTTPVEKLVKFVEISDKVIGEMELSYASEQLVGRVSSGELYFSLVVDRVPDVIPNENGELLKKAVVNAVQPRFLFPEKANLGGDSWLVKKYTGLYVAGDESETSVGLGYMAEFYIDFGVTGVVILSLLWGLLGSVSIAMFARVSPSREIFFALVIVSLTGYFMSFDGSFIKLFAGYVQRTLVLTAALFFFGSYIHRWMTAGSLRG